MYRKCQLHDSNVLVASELSNYFISDGILESCDEYLSRKWASLFPSALKALVFAEQQHLQTTRASCMKVRSFMI
jgi:hypothetical protein